MLIFSRINRNIRSLRRYRVILGILIKYGFGHILEQLNVNYYIELGKKIVTFGSAPREVEHLTPAERLRLAMEELGPTFIKLGQVLSTRPDLLPGEFIEEFRKLQDRVPSLPLEDIVVQVEKELGGPIDSLFSWFSPVPVAAASIAQVHRGRLPGGEEVVIKVRRPGIRELMETDLDVLLGLAHLVDRHVPNSELYDPIGLVKEFRRVVNREMDFSREGRTIDRFALNFADDPTVYFPKVYWDFTGETVLTMEFIDGVKVSDISLLTARGHDLKAIARRGADAILKQVLVHGFFHGDPHPGNVFVLEGDRLCFLDFGMVGRLTKDLKYQLVELLMAVLQRDADRVIFSLLYSGEILDETNARHLKRDLSELIDEYYEIPLQEFNAGELLTDFVEVLTHHRIKLHPDLMLLAKALVTIEGIGRQLDPEFNMVGHLKPFMRDLVRERVNPLSLSREWAGVLQSYGALAKHLPHDIKEFINRINRNKFKIDLEHRGLERLIIDLDKSSNRLSFSLIIAALVIGSSILMQTERGPFLFGFPLLGFLGYSIAALLGLWLAIAILRSGRL